MKRVGIAVAAVAILAAIPAEAKNARSGNNASGGNNAVQLRLSGPVQGRYIVVLRDDVANPAAVANEMARSHGLGRGFLYSTVIKGFSASVPEAALAGLRRDPRVAFIEADQWMHASATATGIQRINVPDLGWGVGDVDTDVAVIDTGIADHPDINNAGRTDCTGGPRLDRWQECSADSGDDGNGHGTHVAGTIGGSTTGVAPGARMWAVKVLKNNGSGWNSNVIAGIEWTVKNPDVDIAVANMSLSGGDSASLCAAIRGAVEAGVFFAVAAGNSATDAGNTSPANCKQKHDVPNGMMTVSALADSDGLAGGGDWIASCRVDEEDTLANFSNYGPAIDVIAPGVCILSTWNDGGYRTISGTSMASPHVAGAAALLASMVPSPDPAAIESTIERSGNNGWTGDLGSGGQEPLLDVVDAGAFAPNGAGDGGEIDAQPTVSITSPANNATVSGEAVAITADAGDDIGVSQVEFFVDDFSIGIDSENTDGWSIIWDSTTVQDGDRTIRATATDTAGQTSNASVSVTVDNIADPPSAGPDHVQIVYNSKKKHLFIDVEVTAADVPVVGAIVVASVTLLPDTTRTATAVTDSSGAARFVWRNAPSGNYETSATVGGATIETDDPGLYR